MSTATITVIPYERGELTVAERVVAKIAAKAAAEVADVGGTTHRVLGVPLGAADQDRLPRVAAGVSGQVAVLDVALSVAYPAPVRRVTERVRARLVARVGELTGLSVRQVDIAVTTLTHPAATRRAPQ